MKTREVWITGLGAVTAAGPDAGAVLRALVDERSGVEPKPELDGMPVAGVAELPRDPSVRRLDRSAALFVTAASEAWRDAGFNGSGVEPGRGAVVEGSSLGPMAELLRSYDERPSVGGRPVTRPSALVRFMIGAGGAGFAQAHGIDGPVLHVSAGSVSATCAIGEAFSWIQSGRADVVVAGGAECPLHREVVEHFRAAGILTREAEAPFPCRPFDLNRAGTVLGEGAAVLVVEASGHARRRGAEPRAVVLGYGLSCEAYSMTAPEPQGAGVAAAARQALAAARADGAGWVKTHGTGTRQNDAAECSGLASLFGADLPRMPLTALKPVVGHCLGASGSVEAAAAVLALQHGFIPAVLGTEQVDPELPPCTVVTETRESRAQTALLLSESFGGRCAALLLALA